MRALRSFLNVFALVCCVITTVSTTVAVDFPRESQNMMWMIEFSAQKRSGLSELSTAYLYTSSDMRAILIVNVLKIRFRQNIQDPSSIFLSHINFVLHDS